ncbi:hypothetical protein D3C79_601080 [compost metagenome]
MVHVVTVHQVAGVQVAVQADELVWCASVDVLHPLEQIAGHGLERRQQFTRDKITLQQGVQRGVAKVVHSQCLTVLERLAGAHGMQAAK